VLNAGNSTGHPGPQRAGPQPNSYPAPLSVQKTLLPIVASEEADSVQKTLLTVPSENGDAVQMRRRNSEL
jgi:hypothetical protein